MSVPVSSLVTSTSSVSSENACNSEFLSSLPFVGQKYVPDFVLTKPDIVKTEFLKQIKILIRDGLTFTDRLLPPSKFSFTENKTFPMSYFTNLHLAVKSYKVFNYMGARIPLEHNNINVKNFRHYLTKFNYPHIHLLQFVEFGFPLGLWSDSYLEPSTNNHSSAYSYFTYIDKFVQTELENVGLTGPFEAAPFSDVMLSPLMTSTKKPSGRRTVFDASFGMFSLNKNTPEKAYHETEYKFTFPKIDTLADIIANLGRGSFLFKQGSNFREVKVCYLFIFKKKNNNYF